MVLGLALVAAAAALSVHGTRPVATAEDSRLVPPDLRWAVYAFCSAPQSIPEGTMAMTFDLTGGVIAAQVVESSAPEEDVEVYEVSLNDCLAGYPLEADGAEPQNTVVTDARRLLAYDVAHRWLLPCLAGHGQQSAARMGIGAYLAPDEMPWLDAYSAVGGEEGALDRLLEARAACGPGDQPFGG